MGLRLAMLATMALAASGFLVPLTPMRRLSSRHGAVTMVAELKKSLPEQLNAWGCDEALWESLRSSGRNALTRLAELGDEDQAKMRIAKLRVIVAAEAAGPKADSKPAESKPKQQAAAPKAVTEPAESKPPQQRKHFAKAAKPTNAPVAAAGGSKLYRAQGKPPPESLDTVKVDELIVKRTAAKKAGEYETADALREELLGMGVKLSDQHKAWSYIGK
mmetsp:Transcript_18296/g.45628  ORF Transcript_18296/g.45628 Transcript_18296/m.45628 type:complete len:218 (-) Transcript_18296:239-892(-)